MALLAFITLIFMGMQVGYSGKPWGEGGWYYGLFLLLMLDDAIQIVIKPKGRVVMQSIGLMAVSGVVLVCYDKGIGMSAMVVSMILIVAVITRWAHLMVLWAFIRRHPTVSFVGGFGVMIGFGALALMWTVSSHITIPFIDALFMATSAVCVTGLSVMDVGNELSVVGQMIMMGLIQVGGLGIMVFYALVTISLKTRLFGHESRALQRGFATESMNETVSIIRSVFFITLIIELIGAIGFYWFMPDTMPYQKKIMYALFHSVSAFCNAGFSLFDNSMSWMAHHTPMMVVVSLLIIIGGVGFPFIFDVMQWVSSRRRHRLKQQTMIVLYMSVAMIFLGTVILYMQSFTTASISLGESFFHAVSSRTAGFSMADVTQYSMASLWGLLLIMMVGASPGSTGGGVKTTTVGIILIAVWHTIQGRDRTKIGNRCISPLSISNAMAMVMLSFFIIFLGVFILLITEKCAFFPLLFETISAYATVGFSLGVTEELSSVGKMVIIGLMVLGRVGPLTLAVALMQRPRSVTYKLPEDTIFIG